MVRTDIMGEPCAVIDDFDGGLSLPGAHSLFVGSSGSGKTSLILHFLLNPTLINPPPRHVYLHYDSMQTAYMEAKRQLESRGISLYLIRGMDGISLNTYKHDDGGQTLVIFDDLSLQTSSSAAIASMVTNARHANVTIWLAWHALYFKSPESRLISQNVSYIFLLPSPRLESQLGVLGSQLGMRQKLKEAFQLATEGGGGERSSYLLIDLNPKTPAKLRLRSHITQVPQYCYF